MKIGTARGLGFGKDHPRSEPGLRRMGEWLVGETELLGLTVQNWLLVAASAFALYGIGLALWRLRPQRPR